MPAKCFPQAIKDSRQRVRLIIADLVNQGIEAVHKSMVVGKSLRDRQSQLVENIVSFSWAHLSTRLIIFTVRQNVANVNLLPIVLDSDDYPGLVAPEMMRILLDPVDTGHNRIRKHLHDRASCLGG
jgi:hypothetical protein